MKSTLRVSRIGLHLSAGTLISRRVNIFPGQRAFGGARYRGFELPSSVLATDLPQFRAGIQGDTDGNAASSENGRTEQFLLNRVFLNNTYKVSAIIGLDATGAAGTCIGPVSVANNGYSTDGGRYICTAGSTG